MIATLKHRDVGLLFAGALVSQAGDYILFAALPFWIYELTGSATAAGLMFVAMMAPQLLIGPVAGVFVDRWNRKTTMVVSDLLRAGIVLGVFLIDSNDQVWLIYLLMFAESSVSRFFLPARTAILPSIAPASQLMSANAAMGMTEAIARLGGPAVGGLLVAAWGARGAAALDALTYLLSAVLISLMRVPVIERAQHPAPVGGMAGVGAVWRDLVDGARVVMSRPVLRALFGVMAVFMLAQGIINPLLVVLIGDVWRSGATGFGLFLSAQGVGSLAGGLLLGGLAHRVSPRMLMVGAGIGDGLLLILMVNQPSIIVAMALVAVAGVLIVGLFISTQTLIQIGSDDHHRGRVASLLMTVTAAVALFSMGLTSALAGAVGAVPMLNLSGLLMMASGALALLMPTAAPARETAATGDTVVPAPR